MLQEGRVNWWIDELVTGCFISMEGIEYWHHSVIINMFLISGRGYLAGGASTNQICYISTFPGMYAAHISE